MNQETQQAILNPFFGWEGKLDPQYFSGQRQSPYIEIESVDEDDLRPFLLGAKDTTSNFPDPLMKMNSRSNQGPSYLGNDEGQSNISSSSNIMRFDNPKANVYL